MRHRLLIWASVGFLVASCWVAYTFITPPDYLGASMRNPIVEAVAYTTCPISLAGRYLPLRFWWIPSINAATYAVIGLILETLRWVLNRRSLRNRRTA
jgi:hypothetical protein